MIPAVQVREYSRTMVTTTNPVGVVRMLVDAALRWSCEAREATERAERKAKGVAIRKTTDIVLELMSCLDFKRGGELALSLEALYVFLIQRLAEANSRNDAAHLDVVVKVLSDLSIAWNEVLQSGGTRDLS